MASFWDTLRGRGVDETLTPLAQVVREHMPGADNETLRVVTATVGLLGHVAFADGVFSDAEEVQLRTELTRVHGLSPTGIDALCSTLRTHIRHISTVEAPYFARELCELVDREVRLEILDVLMDLAAADDVLAMSETNQLRLVATALGLSQEDYTATQARHREKLTVLRDH